MATKVKTSEKDARFDLRLTKEQRDFFEYAATLGHFRTMTEFVIFSIQQSANQIVKEHNAILASQKDKEIFFKAILNPSKPNTALQKAADRYKKAISRK